MSENIKQFLEADALLPCPFCNSRAAYENGDDRQYGKYTRVYCCFCDASITDTREKYAIATWNTRTPDRNLLADFEQVCEAIQIASECGEPEFVSLYDEECVEGLRWVHPDGREWTEIGREITIHPLLAEALTAATASAEAKYMPVIDAAKEVIRHAERGSREEANNYYEALHTLNRALEALAEAAPLLRGK